MQSSRTLVAVLLWIASGVAGIMTSAANTPQGLMLSHAFDSHPFTVQSLIGPALFILGLFVFLKRS